MPVVCKDVNVPTGFSTRWMLLRSESTLHFNEGSLGVHSGCHILRYSLYYRNVQHNIHGNSSSGINTHEGNVHHLQFTTSTSQTAGVDLLLCAVGNLLVVVL